MAITVLPATEADLHALGRIHDRAFRPSIINRLIWGAVTEEDSAASFARYFSKALKKPRTKVFKAVDSADGEIKGLSFWMLPLADGEEPEKDKEPSEPAPGTNKELAKEFFGMLDKCKEQYEKRHLHLVILAIDPAAQGNGIGKALLDWGLRYADETSVPLYLEASDGLAHATGTTVSGS
ncbi:hypothetical protein Rhopal_004615-T1 [Rhodotorula paludigena]|uniref:N-acetyltransferase domain-containing protein n=1 Tax=Rhodotorula paludigena TaxID=86838 RepID=A0AAV5GQ18_9BASI|nr:hypothetical protein Rhopal_004615-T1 [Rhodotorula paludigena]